jgi:hypothetical protein
MDSPACVLRLKIDSAQKSHTAKRSRGGLSSSKERIFLMTRFCLDHSEPRRTRRQREHVIKSRPAFMAKSFLVGVVDSGEDRL